MSYATDDRIARERAFHNGRFADETRHAQGKYYFATKPGGLKLDAKLAAYSKDADVLEYGCGSLARIHGLAQNCKTAVGIDISDVAVAEANGTAKTLGLTNCRFLTMNAEDMDFPDASFDFVFGRGIIHHLDVERSFHEIARVLRPGGRAVFWEPLGHNILINGYRRATPDVRSVDEHPLLKHDFDTAHRHFDTVETDFYGLTSLISIVQRDKPVGEKLLHVTTFVDKMLFKIPGMKWQAWYCLLDMRAKAA